jgi:hypothetical protein
MSSKFEEKQAVEKDRKDKEHYPGEKLKAEKAEKDDKEIPDTKHPKDTKDNKDQPDSKNQKDHKEGHKDTKESKEITKEHKEAKDNKDHSIDKHLVEVPREAQLHQASLATPAHAAGITKFAEKPLTDTKFAHKEFIKIEIKEFKHEKHEKVEIKEKFEWEKFEYEGWRGGPGGGPGPVEQRLAALEATLAQLSHFIPKELRPDLSQGALRQEADAPAAESAQKSDPKVTAKKP